jgi:hypothetical protein
MYLCAAGLLAAMPRQSLAQLRSCPSAPEKAQEVRAYAAEYITSPDWADFRSYVGITTGDTSSLSIVASDSVCDAVTAVMDSISGTRNPHALLVIKFQSLFIAVEPDGTGIIPMYVFDNRYRLKATLRVPD